MKRYIKSAIGLSLRGRDSNCARGNLTIFSLLLMVAFAMPVSAFAATSAGVTPGSFWYFFDTASEKIALFFTFNPENKAKKALEYADERLAEIDAIAGDKNPDAVKAAIVDYEGNVTLATEKSKEVKDKGQAESLLASIESSASKNQETLSAVLIKVPEEAKAAITQAIEASKKGQEEAARQIVELKGEVEKLKQEVAELKQAKDASQSSEVEKLKKEVEVLRRAQQPKSVETEVVEKVVEKTIEIPRATPDQPAVLAQSATPAQPAIAGNAPATSTTLAVPVTPATPATPAQPTGQTGVTTVSATPATPASPIPTTPPITQYTITVTQGTNGTISPGTTMVTSGGGKVFTIMPATGYQIEGVIVDGVNQGAISTYTFVNVTSTHMITATFIAVPVTQYTITVTQGANGAISPWTTSVISGASQTFVITPNTGYQIASVTVDETNQGVVSSYSFTNVTAAHTISASFSLIQTPTPLPFSDNFNDGNADGWVAAMPLSVYSREPATWRVENQQVINTPLLTSGDNYKFLLDNYSLFSLSAEARVLFYGSGYGGLTIWHYDLDNWVDIVGYPASLGKDGKPLMIIQAIDGVVTTTKYPYIWWGTGNGEGVWTDMKVIANSDTGMIDVYINNQRAVTHQTQVIHRYGLSGFNSGNGGGAFDDFKLDTNSVAR